MLTDSEVNVKDLRTNHSVSLCPLGLDNVTVAIAADNKTVIVTPDTLAIKGGNYEFKVVAGFVTDDSSTPNNNKKVSKAVNFGEVANEVKVLTYYNYDTNEVLVGFNQPVKTWNLLSTQLII